MLSHTATTGHGPVAVAQPKRAELPGGVPSRPDRASNLRKRLVLTTAVVLAVLPGGVGTALAADQCVGAKPGCLPTIQAALDVARDGDTIRIGRGTFEGGITIDANVQLIGVGAGATVIRGGGPVVTIGVFDAPSVPTVTIEGVTITGGVTSASGRCGPTCATNFEQATALGGGIAIPPAADGATGATVTVADSVVAGNRVAPATTVPSVRSICPTGPCRFAAAGGGGIDNSGALTLRNTRVSDNEAAGPLTSEAYGGGILQQAGSLTLERSVVTRNRATASTPNGRFAEGAGIFAVSGTLTIVGGGVTRNVAELSSAFPSDVNQAGIGGGLFITPEVSPSILGAAIEDNRLSVTNAIGDAIAFSGGIHADGPITIRNSTVSRNRVTLRSPTRAEGDSGGGEINGDATISHTRITGNSIESDSPAGTAYASTGGITTAAFAATTITDSLVAGNRVTARSAAGTAVAHAGGLANGGMLWLRDSRLSDNRARSIGPAGEAQGGGIWNGQFPDGPTPLLNLIHSSVTHNLLRAAPGVAVQGGGVFTTVPVSLTDSRIARNAPDQCFGC